MHIYISFNNKNCFKNTLIGNTFTCVKQTKEKKRHFIPWIYLTHFYQKYWWFKQIKLTSQLSHAVFPATKIQISGPACYVLAISVLTASLLLNSFVLILVVWVKRIIHIQVICLFYCNMDRWNQTYIVYFKKSTYNHLFL